MLGKIRRESDWTMTRCSAVIAEPRAGEDVKVTVPEPRGMKVTKPRDREDKTRQCCQRLLYDLGSCLHLSSLGHNSSGPQAIILILFAYTVPRH